MKNSIKMALMFVLFMFCIVTGFTIVMLDITSWCKKLRLKKDCNYILPKNYKLVKSIGTGKYAILLDGKGYLKYTYSGDNITDISVPEYATTFNDSCKAKAFCKQILEFKFQ